MSPKLISPYPRLKARKKLEGEGIVNTELNEKLSKLVFWCGNEKIHIEKPDTYHLEYCCFTHVVGLPAHPATGELLPLTPYQVECFNEISKQTTKPKNIDRIEWLRKPHKFHVLKGRQMGFTEIILRIIQYYSFSRYSGKNVGIIAATNGSLSKYNLYRFYLLFNNIKGTIDGGVKNKEIMLTNGTFIQAFPAAVEAMTGLTKFACVFMDESAKWINVDDTPIFESIMPIVRANGSDLFLVGTPRKPMKMFYKIYKNPADFVMLEYDIWRSEGNLYTKEQIEEMVSSAEGDPNQEYLCKFTHGESAIFGDYIEDMMSDEVVEWGDDMKDNKEDEESEERDITPW